MMRKIAGYLGYVKKSEINDKLNFARSVAKRLDEHRETVEAIAEKTTLLNDFWHVSHLATQDDYLMRLYYLVHNEWPLDGKHSANGFVRNRPEVLGKCGLPEYSHEISY